MTATNKKRERYRRLRLEILESRRLLAVIGWNNPISGEYHDANNWVNGVVPGAADDAIISESGTYTVSLLDNGTPKDANSLSLTVENDSGVVTLDLQGKKYTTNSVGVGSKNDNNSANSTIKDGKVISTNGIVGGQNFGAGGYATIEGNSTSWKIGDTLYVGALNSTF